MVLFRDCNFGKKRPFELTTQECSRTPDKWQVFSFSDVIWLPPSIQIWSSGAASVLSDSRPHSVDSCWLCSYVSIPYQPLNYLSGDLLFLAKPLVFESLGIGMLMLWAAPKLAQLCARARQCLTAQIRPCGERCLHRWVNVRICCYKVMQNCSEKLGKIRQWTSDLCHSWQLPWLCSLMNR